MKIRNDGSVGIWNICRITQMQAITPATPSTTARAVPNADMAVTTAATMTDTPIVAMKARNIVTFGTPTMRAENHMMRVAITTKAMAMGAVWGERAAGMTCASPSEAIAPARSRIPPGEGLAASHGEPVQTAFWMREMT